MIYETNDDSWWLRHVFEVFNSSVSATPKMHVCWKIQLKTGKNIIECKNKLLLLKSNLFSRCFSTGTTVVMCFGFFSEYASKYEWTIKMFRRVKQEGSSGWGIENILVLQHPSSQAIKWLNVDGRRPTHRMTRRLLDSGDCTSSKIKHQSSHSFVYVFPRFNRIKGR